MKGAKETLNPVLRQYNIRKYHEHMFMMQLLNPQVAELFLTPLLSNSPIDCPLLSKLQQIEPSDNSNAMLSGIT